jgi:hypothetical protein
LMSFPTTGFMQTDKVLACRILDDLLPTTKVVPGI